MSMVNLMDSSLPAMWSKIIYDQDGYVISANHCDKVAYCLFTGASQALSGMKSKDYPVAYTFESANGEFLAAGIAEWIEPVEDEKQPGHWNYVWTLDRSDIPDNARVNSITNPMTWSYFRGVAGQKYAMAFEPNSEGALFTRLIAVILQWLDDNASEDEEVGIMLDGVFQARVAVEDGEKVKAIEMIGETKQIIKFDMDNE